MNDTRIITLIVIVSVSLIFGACKTNTNTKVEDSKYSYNYSENGCSTGAHSFDSLSAYCNALMDDRLNRGCAVAMRSKAFEQQCDGASTGDRLPDPGSVPTPSGELPTDGGPA